MKAALIAAVLLLATVEFGQALECYECESNESWEKCSSKEIECPSGYNRCSEVEEKYKVGGNETKRYARGCMTKKDCDNWNDILKTCKDATNSTCNGSCCSEDFCNSSTGSVVIAVSGALILSCAFFAMIQ